MRRTKTIRAMALVVAVGLAALGSACGGDDDEGISKADYLAQAKVICQKGSQALTSAANDVLAKQPPGEKPSEPEIEDYVRKTVIPTIRDQIAQLRALPPPKGEKKHIDEIFNELEKGVDQLEKDPKKLAGGGDVFAEATKLATKYGISICETPG